MRAVNKTWARHNLIKEKVSLYFSFLYNLNASELDIDQVDDDWWIHTQPIDRDAYS